MAESWANATWCSIRITKRSIGDAGHVTLLVDGQGTNTGIQDRFALAWRLAGTLRNETNLLVLDSFSFERGQVGKKFA